MLDKSEISRMVRAYVENLSPEGCQEKQWIVAANWKMNMTAAETEHFLDEFLKGKRYSNIRTIIFPPFPYLYLFAKRLRYEKIAFGAQDVSFQDKGAYTGEVSGTMLRDLCCSYAICGHSERRRYHGESSEEVAKKAKAALKVQLTPVICIGETQDERNQGRYREVLSAQIEAVKAALGKDIEKTIFAYEPVWAIGTGVIPTMEQVAETHGFIISCIGCGKVPVLYGGSANEKNVTELSRVPGVSGFLIGGAGLKAESFGKIHELLGEVR